MKRPLLGFIFSVLALSAVGQGTFQNLDFESAVLVPLAGDPLGRVQFAAAFPGWTGYVGANLQTLADHNNRSLSASGIAIVGPDYPSPNHLQGHFYAELYIAFPGPATPVALNQIGTIPVGTKSIRFYGGAFDPPFVDFAGNSIPVIALQNASTYTVYGGDISAFAGITGELSFRGSRLLDNIQFSNLPIPEPSTLGLLGLSGVLLGWRFGRKR